MFFFGGQNQRWKALPNGRVETLTCPRCHTTARFVEGRRTTTYSGYFVDLLDDSDIAYACSACQAVVPVSELQLDHTVSDSAAERQELANQETQRRREEQERHKAAAAMKEKVEKQLRELKRRVQKPKG